MLSLRELSLLQQAEVVLGRRVHKGHPLHNYGAATLRSDQQKARQFFHAALIEDIRTAGGLTNTPARLTLQALYGEPNPMLGRLVALALDSTGDPLRLARRFERTEALPPYRGFRAGWKKLSWLDTVPSELLVFVGGAHAHQAGIMALRDAVIAEGFIPVVVMEFEDFVPNASRKSQTLMQRCRAVLLDVTIETPGWALELTFVKQLKVPRFGTFMAWSAADPPHAGDMTKGFEEELGIDLVAFTDPATMVAETRRWLREHVPVTSGLLQTDYFTPAPGTAGSAAYSSNARFVMSDSGAVPATLVYAPAVPTTADQRLFANRVRERSVDTEAGPKRQSQPAGDKTAS